MAGGRKPLGDPRDGLAPLLNFRMARQQAELLDRLAEQSGRTRSELMRAALDRYLAEELKEAAQAS